LFYCRQGSSKEIEKKFQDNEIILQKENLEFRGNSLPHLWTFLIEENDQILLKSFTMFSSQLCGSVHAVNINQFLLNTSTWLTQNFFANDIFNFHGCEIVFGPIYVGNSYYDPEVLVIVDALARSLNYTPGYNPFIKSILHFNTSKQVDCYFVLNSIVLQNGFYSVPFQTVSFGLTVPFGENYSSLEKLLWPFQFEVWIIFGLLFFIAFFTVFIINRFVPHNARCFIYGKNVTTPSLNIFLIFMGGGMTILPRRNFGRYILMCFILFCLVMR
jgi:hypothetical protein